MKKTNNLCIKEVCKSGLKFITALFIVLFLSLLASKSMMRYSNQAHEEQCIKLKEWVVKYDEFEPSTRQRTRCYEQDISLTK